MKQVIPGKSRVRETRTPGSVRAKAEWLSYSTYPTGPLHSTFVSSPAATTNTTEQNPCARPKGLLQNYNISTFFAVVYWISRGFDL